MSSMMQEAYLYGDLVLHLRDHWVEEVAGHSSNPELMRRIERARIDEMIRKWFFTPEAEDLQGSTPRDVIRREERGEPNIVPLEHHDEKFSDNYLLCRAMKSGELDLGEMCWAFCPDMTLLDMFDQEGYDAKYSDPQDTELSDEQ